MTNRHRTPTGKHRYTVNFKVGGAKMPQLDQETVVIAENEPDARQRGARKIYGARAYWKLSGVDAFHGWVYRKVRKDAPPWARETLLTDHIICAVERVKP